jgi:hypothetical protein
MPTLSERVVLAQLISAYEQEDAIYAALEEAAAEQQAVLRNGRDPFTLDRLLDQQRSLAEDVGRIEAGIAPLRQYWEQRRDTHRHSPDTRRLAMMLDHVLDGLAERIHRIVAIQKQNSLAIITEPISEIHA